MKQVFHQQITELKEIDMLESGTDQFSQPFLFKVSSSKFKPTPLDIDITDLRAP